MAGRLLKKSNESSKILIPRPEQDLGEKGK
jgi:hypothetical protein